MDNYKFHKLLQRQAENKQQQIIILSEMILELTEEVIYLDNRLKQVEEAINNGQLG